MKIATMGVLTAFAGTALMVGCGGGGGGVASSTVSSTATASNAEGAYQGTVSNGREHYTLVLENNQYYTLYGNTSGAIFYVYGFLQGTGTGNNGNYSSTDLRDFTYTGSVLNGSLSATYSPGVSFSGTITETGLNASFNGASIPATTYDYKTGASLTNIVGSWSMTTLQGAPASLSIASAGTFSGSSNGCAYSGTLQPRGSGKNVFNFSLTFGPAPCLLPNQSASGIGITFLLSSGKRELIIAGTDSSRANGSVLFGAR